MDAVGGNVAVPLGGNYLNVCKDLFGHVDDESPPAVGVANCMEGENMVVENPWLVYGKVLGPN